jgi:fumarate hydratase class II
MRIEHDSMGEMLVPDDALYGASTQRAVVNFPVSGRPMPAAFVHGLGLVKLACAVANEELGILSVEKSRLIQQIAQEVIDGKLDAHFPVDVFQTGSGTSSSLAVRPSDRRIPFIPTTMSTSASRRTTSSQPRCM